MNRNHFNNGDKVTSQKIGPPLIGEVFGTMHARYWSQMQGINPDLWHKLYPGWLDKLVIYIVIDKPIIPISLKEYSDTVPQGTSQYEIKEGYNLQPKNRFLVLPEQDLLKVEEIE